MYLSIAIRGKHIDRFKRSGKKYSWRYTSTEWVKERKKDEGREREEQRVPARKH